MHLDSSIIDFFTSCSLEELENLQLLKRKDTKFLLPFHLLNPFLKDLSSDYKILESNGNRIFNYRNIYYDTPQRTMFLQHHNKKINRYKIRKRIYTDTATSWGEIKQKTKNNTTKKKRILLNSEKIFDEFIKTETPFSISDLSVSLENKFKRITLINSKINEKITVDFDVESFFKEKQIAWPFLGIIEVKSKNINQSLVFDLMKKYGIRAHTFSKYAVAMLYLNNDLKYNNLKETLLLLNKIKQNNDT